MARIVALAESEERRFAELTGKSRARLGEQRNRLGELNAHRHTYAESAPQAGQIAAAHWKDYQRFLMRLDDAVRSQQQIIKDCEKAFETHRRRWLVKRQRLESLQRVLDRFRQEEQVAADRREQRNLDDLPRNRRRFVTQK